MLGFVKSQKKRDLIISQNSRGFMIKTKKQKQKQKIKTIKKDNVTL